MIKIAICYWGMTRSTRFVYESHIKNIYNVLNRNNIDYEIFMHTWKTLNNKNIIWENEIDIDVDYDEYKLLNPNHYNIEDQSIFLEKLNFCDYFDEKLYEIYGGDTDHEWRPQLIKNHLCALESQKRVYNMVKNTVNKQFDYIIFIRPDVNIWNELSLDFLNYDFDIIIPNYNHYDGFNDIFAIIPFNKSEHYSCRIDEIIEFRKNNGRIVSEKYLKFIINKYYNKVIYIDFMMTVVRPDRSMNMIFT